MNDQQPPSGSGITLFFCGDVMTGRGVDQILPHPVDPRIFESYVKDARVYVHLAEEKNGPLDKPVSYSYIWGDAVEIWKQMDPVFRIINLETSITDHDRPWPGKGINYRMHPKNIEVLISAGIDFCSLANNHILDWGREGLFETIKTLEDVDIAYAGAGSNLNDAGDHAILISGESRLIIFAFGSGTSGVPGSWAADSETSGVNMLPSHPDEAVKMIGRKVRSVKQKKDIVVISIHWGGNWGYRIPGHQRNLAHNLIDHAGVDIIHGHSSHHPRGIEVYKDKLILYGAGDFINDYEGISGYEHYRDDLTLMYFPCIDPSDGRLICMKMVPMHISNLRLNHASASDARWLLNILNREGSKLGTGATWNKAGYYSLDWD